MQDWEFLAKNVIDISKTFINYANLSRPDVYILGPGYLEEKISCFTEVIIKDEIQEIAEEPKISNSKEKKKRLATLRKNKRDVWSAVCFSAGCLHKSFTTRLVSSLFSLSTSTLLATALFASAISIMPVLLSSALSISVRSAMSAMPIFCLPALFASTRFVETIETMPHLSALSASAGFARLGLDLSAQSTSASFILTKSALPILNLSILSTFAKFVEPVFGWSTLSASALSVSARSVLPIPDLSALSVFALSAFTKSAVPMPGFSTLSISVFFASSGSAMPVTSLSTSAMPRFRSFTFLH